MRGGLFPELEVQIQQPIAAKIQAGWDAAKRGELSDESQVRARMQQRKRQWAKQRPA